MDIAVGYCFMLASRYGCPNQAHIQAWGLIYSYGITNTWFFLEPASLLTVRLLISNANHGLIADDSLES